VRGGDAHPTLGGMRQRAGGLAAKTYPLSAVGEAIADGIARRRRWIVVPPWARAVLVLRTALAPLLDRQSVAPAAEAEALFERDVATRGAEAASQPVGPGGEAAREPAADPA
jgi:hypothetical protein